MAATQSRYKHIERGFLVLGGTLYIHTTSMYKDSTLCSVLCVRIYTRYTVYIYMWETIP